MKSLTTAALLLPATAFAHAGHASQSDHLLPAAGVAVIAIAAFALWRAARGN